MTVDMVAVKDEATGYWHRPETMDMFVVKERFDYMALEPRETDVLLDLGANIGSVARLFADKVRYVVSVEPDPENLVLLERNTNDLNGKVIIVGAAATMTGDPVELWRNQGTNKGSHSLVVKGGREPINVAGVALPALMETYQPTLVKCDIEGGEWSLLECFYNLPRHVRGVAMELHLNRKDWRDNQAPAMVASMEAQGFHAVKVPKLTGRRWYTMGIWLR